MERYAAHVTYRGREASGSEVAIHVTDCDNADPDAIRATLSKLSHSNLARFVDAGMTETNRLYVTSEFVRGLPITEYADQAHLPLSDRISLLANICDALCQVHEFNVAHGHVDSASVLVCREGGSARAVLTGLAIYHLAERQRDFEDRVRSDVRALCSVLYELLTGRVPDSTHPVHPSDAVSDETARLRRVSLEGLRRELRAGADEVLERGLAPEPIHGYETASQFAADPALLSGDTSRPPLWRRLLGRT